MRNLPFPLAGEPNGQGNEMGGVDSPIAALQAQTLFVHPVFKSLFLALPTDFRTWFVRSSLAPEYFCLLFLVWRLYQYTYLAFQPPLPTFQTLLHPRYWTCVD